MPGICKLPKTTTWNKTITNKWQRAAL